MGNVFSKPIQELVDESFACCFCDKIYSGNGNNAEPVKAGGVCCHECCLDIIVPVRMAELAEQARIRQLEFDLTRHKKT